MKTTPKLALAALMVLSPGPLMASPYFDGHYSHNTFSHSHFAPDYHCTPPPPPVCSSVRVPTHHYAPTFRGHDYYRTERDAQLRLRQLGYYYGPIDGIIGRGSQRAIVRFQRDYHLPPTGWLDHRTLRALRVSR